MYAPPGKPAAVIGLTRYGASAKYETMYKELGLTVEKVVETAKGLAQSP
jgi:transketolase